MFKPFLVEPTSSQVLLPSNNLKMAVVNTSFVTAKMVNVHAANRPFACEQEDTDNLPCVSFVTNADRCVARGVMPSRPQPTRAKIRPVRGYWSILVHSRPEAVGESSYGWQPVRVSMHAPALVVKVTQLAGADGTLAASNATGATSCPNRHLVSRITVPVVAHVVSSAVAIRGMGAATVKKLAKARRFGLVGIYSLWHRMFLSVSARAAVSAVRPLFAASILPEVAA